MEFLPYTIKWLEVILRWGHVLFAILWVGNSFLFNYLDNNLNKNITSDDIDGEGYLMHSGFFYKLSRLKTSPPQDYLNRLVPGGTYIMHLDITDSSTGKSYQKIAPVVIATFEN